MRHGGWRGVCRRVRVRRDAWRRLVGNRISIPSSDFRDEIEQVVNGKLVSAASNARSFADQDV